MSKNPRTKERHQEELAEQPEGSTSKSQNQEAATLPDDKQGRLLSLAKKLQQIFPEQYEELAQVIERVEKGKLGSRKTVECEQSLFRSRPIARAVSGGSTIDQEEEEEIDPRGPAPEQKDPLIHIFVDQYVHDSYTLSLLSSHNLVQTFSMVFLSPNLQRRIVNAAIPFPEVGSTLSQHQHPSLVLCQFQPLAPKTRCNSCLFLLLLPHP